MISHTYHVRDLRDDNLAAARRRHRFLARKFNHAPFTINCPLATGIIALLSINCIHV